MSKLYLFNKPFRVLSQFTDLEGRSTLADFITESGIYPAGRLDYDSEGLLLLTDDGQLQHRIASPEMKLAKTYVIQVEGEITDDALQQLKKGIRLKDGMTRPAKARRIDDPGFAPRNPPVRERKNIPTSWVELVISEGRNRQVRRMSAAVGFPTLRLIRTRIGNWSLEGLKSGDSRELEVNLPVAPKGQKVAPKHRKKGPAPGKKQSPAGKNRKRPHSKTDTEAGPKRRKGNPKR